MFERLVALRSSAAFAALGAVGTVALLYLLISLEIRRIRRASPASQLDLVQRVLNRHGDSGLGLSPRQKFQLALERLSERRGRMARLFVGLVAACAALFVLAALLLPAKAPTATVVAPIATAAPSGVPSSAAVGRAPSEHSPAPASSQASAATLLFTLVSVKLAPGAGDYTDFRLTTFVNGFRNSYPTASPWADLKEPSLPHSFPVDLERDYRIAFKGQLRMKNGTERSYAPQPVDVFEWRGRDAQRVYASPGPLVIEYKISDVAKPRSELPSGAP